MMSYRRAILTQREYNDVDKQYIEELEVYEILHFPEVQYAMYDRCRNDPDERVRSIYSNLDNNTIQLIRIGGSFYKIKEFKYIKNMDIPPASLELNKLFNIS